jgi:hypothetical protein
MELRMRYTYIPMSFARVAILLVNSSPVHRLTHF